MKKAIIIGIVFAAITIGIIFFVFLQIKDIKENQTLTGQLSPALLEQLQEKTIRNFPYAPAAIEWEGKYLLVDDGHVYEENRTPIYFTYNKKRNEELNTDLFFPGNDIKGIVWLEEKYEVVGDYTNGAQALQPYYILYYIDLAQQAILAQDTLWGGMPPQSTTNSGAEFGKEPKEEDVVKTIQNRIKN